MVKTEGLPGAAIFWSGGKNSYLALHRAMEDGFEVRCLICLHLIDDPAHPMSGIFEQSSKLGIPLQLIPIGDGESLDEALQVLIERYDLTALYTGDVQTGGIFTEMVEESAKRLEIKCVRPLWEANRFHLLSEMIEREIVARITFLGHTSLPQEWLGRELDVRLIADLARYTDLDLSGENGEYHTMVEI